jgi:two-component system, OmpR family, sensor kinase
VRLAPRTLRGRLAVLVGVVTVVLSGLVAGFVLVRYHNDVTSQLDQNLETRLQDVVTEVRRAPRPVTGRDLPILPRGEVFAQVLDQHGNVLAASPSALLDRTLLSTADLRRLPGRHTVERQVPPHGDKSRLLAGSVRVGNQPLVVVVGTSIGPLERAEDQLERAVAIALAVLALLVTSGGWIALGAALRPVRSMVAEADAYSVRRRGQRLSVPGAAELADLAGRLNALLERIEAAIDHERAFLDDASHELRTPIAIARGELELAALQGSADPAAAAAIRSALEEVEHLERLAADLLVLARTRAAGPPPEAPVDLRAVTARAVQTVRRAGPEHVSIGLSGEATTTGDEAALERAFVNVVENAARNARTEVQVTVADAGAAARVQVRDDGPGFPPTVLDEARGRFVHGTPGGTGLGLAIVDAIVVAHGGRLRLTSIDGAGAEVVVELPVAR